jgi:putative endonuclease
MAWTWLRKLATNPTPKMALGERGEEFAARFLRRRGYKILVRRFKSRGGEIDIVCRERSESVQRKKQRHLSKAALDYLRLLDNPPIRWRFDIVEVLLRTEARQPDDLRLIQNAFDLTEPYIY